MSFKPECTGDFLKVFENSRMAIASFEGCRGLKLLQDVKHKNVYLTYSIWEEEQNLETYRHSELFKETWAQTKILFNDKPIAWSTQIIDLVK